MVDTGVVFVTGAAFETYATVPDIPRNWYRLYTAKVKIKDNVTMVFFIVNKIKGRLPFIVIHPLLHSKSPFISHLKIVPNHRQ